MNPEEPIQPETGDTTTEAPQPGTSESVETVPADDPMLAELKMLNETMAWSIAFQVAIMCVLIMTLFFTALKAGKS